jgi:hypothetical protein
MSQEMSTTDDSKYTKKSARTVATRLQWSTRLNIALAAAICYVLWSCRWSPPGNYGGDDGAGLDSKSSTAPQEDEIVSSKSVWAQEVSAVLRTDRSHLTALTRSGAGNGVDLPAFLSLFGLSATVDWPPQVKRVVIDVGWQYVSEFEGREGSNPFARGFGPAPDRLLIGFEANPKTWRAASAVKESELGRMKCTPSSGCVLVLPLAVSPGGKPLSFNAASESADTGGCDSLLAMTPPALSLLSPGDWPCIVSNGWCSYMGNLHREAMKRCMSVGIRGTWWTPFGEFLTDMHAALNCIRDHRKTSAEQLRGVDRGDVGQHIVVPSIELGELLAYIPQNVDVSLVKVDAQGADLIVLRTMGKEGKSRVGKIQIEVQDLKETDRLRMYAGGATRKKASKEITSWGFVEERCVLQNCAVGEMNCVFRRNA